MKKLVFLSIIISCCLLFLTGCTYHETGLGPEEEYCAECGKKVYIGNAYYRGDKQEYLCSSCFYIFDLTKCDGCGDYYDSDDCYETKGDYFYCESCIEDSEKVRQCYCCEEFIPNGYMELVETRFGDYVCEDCIENGYYSYCPICDILEESDELFYSNYYDDNVCIDCYEEHN